MIWKPKGNFYMGYVCFIVNEQNQPLMPTTNPKKVRKLLANGKAEIYKREPFTIKLLYHVEPDNQPIEIGVDTGYQHIGFSVKSEKHEYWSAEYVLLPDEKIHHMDQLMYRRARRSRLRHRRCKFKDRKDADRLTNKKEGWLAPSLRNKAERHVDLIRRFSEVCPITSTVLEVGQFDTNVLHAVNAGQKVPYATDYQRGLNYGFDTVREAVFQRDHHTCQICGKTVEQGAILCLHHIGFRNRDRSNRSSNLLTVCRKCHTSKNHEKGGKLYNLKPAKTVKDAAFMNSVKWEIVKQVKELGIETHITYGAMTKRKRLGKHIEKSHAADAYCIGEFMPSHRSRTKYFNKKRRNNRVLIVRFEDAKYVDKRDGSIKTGQQLSCGRTKRSEPRNGEKNLRKYRGRKVSPGKRPQKHGKSPVEAGDLYRIDGRVCRVIGNNLQSKSLILDWDGSGKRKTRKLEKCELVKKFSGGWRPVDPSEKKRKRR